MAETEINVMDRQCPDRWLDSQRLPAEEVAAWQETEMPRRCESTGE